MTFCETYVHYDGKEDDEDNAYELIDGHRRLAAAKAIGMKKVPVTVCDVNKENALVLSIVSNTKRENLSIIEQGFAYKELIDKGLFKTQRELAKQFGMDESTVASTINHLKLDKKIIEDLIENKSIADQRILKSIRSIDKINDDGLSEKQRKVYQHIVENSINIAVDIRGLDEEKISKIDALRAKI